MESCRCVNKPLVQAMLWTRRDQPTAHELTASVGSALNNTGLFEIIVGVLTTCHTQYT